MLKNKRGQSTLEYILLVTAVVVVLLGFLASKTGIFQTSLNATLTQGTNGMNNMSIRLSGSRPLSP